MRFRIAKLAATLLTYLIVVAPLGAEIMVSTIDDSAHSYAPLENIVAQEVSWMQSDAFSNVSIAVEIDPGGSLTISHSFSGTAYLTTDLGPGTTSADEIADTSFSVTGTAFNPTLETLFDGLTLGPGTYYLVLVGSSGSGIGGVCGWEVDMVSSPVTTGPGITIVDKHGYSPIVGYPPANTFSTPYLYSLQYSVTGDEVPEPSTAVLWSAGLAVFVFSVRRRSPANPQTVTTPSE
jgi:hypothetical protein